MPWHTFWLIPRPFSCIEHIGVVFFGIYKIRQIKYARGLRLLVIFSTDQFEGILPKGPCLPCLRMADRALFWQDTLELCHYFRVIPLHWDNLKISLSANASAQYHAGLVYSFRKDKAPLRLISFIKIDTYSGHVRHQDLRTSNDTPAIPFGYSSKNWVCD